MHRHLDSEPGWGQPFEHWLGRLCDEFHCLPTQAFREWQRCPAGLMETIIEYRLYAQAHAVYRQNPKATGELVDLVRQFDFESAHEAMDAQHLHDRD